MIKIFIATAAYNGLVYSQYATSLVDTSIQLANQGISAVIQINNAGALLVVERNLLVKQFLESDCTHMLCIDSDLGWPPETISAFIQHNLDFIGGVYPSRTREAYNPNKKNTFYFKPLFNEDKTLKSEKGLVEMEHIPAGFMLLKRHMLEKMIELNPQLHFTYNAGGVEGEGYWLFNAEVENGEVWGEDFVFCHRARKAGFRIWVDPFVEFNHAGTRGSLVQAFNRAPSSAK